MGDTVYCRRKPPFETHGQMLHAGKLILNHPATGENGVYGAAAGILERILEKLPIRE